MASRLSRSCMPLSVLRTMMLTYRHHVDQLYNSSGLIYRCQRPALYSIDVSRKQAALVKFERARQIIDDTTSLLDGTSIDEFSLISRLEEARDLLHLALSDDADNVNVMLALGRLHLHQRGHGFSQESGVAILSLAANAGLAEAQYELACWLRSKNNLSQSIAYLKEAANQNHPEALFLLGAALFAGEVLEQNSVNALKCFRASAEQGYIPAAVVAGAMIAKEIQREGALPREDEELRDVNQHEISMKMEEESHNFFQIAAEAGDKLAAHWLQKE